MGRAEPRHAVLNPPVFVAGLLDVAGTKATVIQRRAEPKDYLDIDALITHGVPLPDILAAGALVSNWPGKPTVIKF